MILSTIAWVSVVVVVLVFLQAIYGTRQAMNKLVSAAQRGAALEIKAMEREAEIAAQNRGPLGWREILIALGVMIGIINAAVNGAWLPLLSIGSTIAVAIIALVVIIKQANNQCAEASFQR